MSKKRDPLTTGEIFSAPGASTLMDELYTGARRLDKIGADLGEAIIDREELEQEVKRDLLILRAKVYRELRSEANRLERKSIPGEDVREALVAERMDDELIEKVAKLAGLEARSDALKEFRRSVSDAISARQSVLASLRDEASAQASYGGGDRAPAGHRPQSTTEREVKF